MERNFKFSQLYVINNYEYKTYNLKHERTYNNEGKIR